MGCGCLFVMIAALSPRLGLLILWLFTPFVNRVFGDEWWWPLLGLVFVPFTTMMYVLVAAPLGPTNFWGWLMVVFGLLIDLRGYFDAYANRQRVTQYSTYQTT
jgi:hypothetical protein